MSTKCVVINYEGRTFSFKEFSYTIIYSILAKLFKYSWIIQNTQIKPIELW